MYLSWGVSGVGFCQQKQEKSPAFLGKDRRQYGNIGKVFDDKKQDLAVFDAKI